MSVQRCRSLVSRQISVLYRLTLSIPMSPTSGNSMGGNLRNNIKLTFCVSSQNGEPVLLFTTYLTKAHDDFWGNVGAPVNISRTLPTRKLDGSENQEWKYSPFSSLNLYRPRFLYFSKFIISRKYPLRADLWSQI